MSKRLIPVERIQKTILLIRGGKVILDADLANLYGVSTKRLNEQVKRNRSRFPDDFMFQLTADEKAEVVANCDHLRRLKFSATLPHAFTEHGTIMAAKVLNSERAVHASVEVVRAFVDYGSCSPQTPNSRKGWVNSKANTIVNSRWCSTQFGH